MENFITIKENVIAEITEKKSKFIANLIKVENKQDAEEKINKIKKTYHDARHNCVAYRIIEENKIIEKSSDDGEPSGTAGGPMLNILQKNNLCNILVIVTRYFGGILLGTGGLVRASSKTAAKKAVKTEKRIVKEETKYEKIKENIDRNNRVSKTQKNDVNKEKIEFERPKREIKSSDKTRNEKARKKTPQEIREEMLRKLDESKLK